MIALAALSVAALLSAAIYLLLGRSTQRIALGFVFLSNGVNLFVLTAAGLPPGARAPFAGASVADKAADPLPQAFVLTAIVISLGATALLLGLAARAHHETRSKALSEDLSP